jgi:AhpD family alkylhydroperoxidase
MNPIKKSVATGITPSKPTPAARKKPAHPVGNFHKRTITPRGFIGDVVSIATEGSTFNKVWVKRELDPQFRETLMLAIARMNDSKYCSWAHREWAAIEGVSEEEIAHIEQLTPSYFDARTRLALSFVLELVAARFGPVSSTLMRKMRATYSAEEIEEITLVAKVMDFANRSSNTLDALTSRLSGKPSRSGRVLDEAIMSGAILCVMPALWVYFSRASNSSISEVVGRMLDYTKQMDAEYMAAEQAQQTPAPRRRRPAAPRKPAARKAQA